MKLIIAALLLFTFMRADNDGWDGRLLKEKEKKRKKNIVAWCVHSVVRASLASISLNLSSLSIGVRLTPLIVIAVSIMCVWVCVCVSVHGSMCEGACVCLRERERERDRERKKDQSCADKRATVKLIHWRIIHWREISYTRQNWHRSCKYLNACKFVIVVLCK